MKTVKKGAAAEKKPRHRSKATKFILMVIKIAIILVTAVTFAAAGMLGGIIYGYISTADPFPVKNLKPEKFTTIIYDSRNNEVTHLSKDENRLWVDYKEIPSDLVNAFVSIEDQRFWTHPGIDIKGLLAIGLDLLKGDIHPRGASTITQQLIKNASGEKDRTLKRKVQEQWKAIQLEKELSKEDILEYYLNYIFLGEGTNGVRTAARTYFGKEVAELNLAECSYIAGLTQNPARYNKYKDEAIDRQHTVLKKMLELDYIDEARYNEAISYQLVFVKKEKEKRVSKYSYFVDAVIDNVVSDLVQKYGWTREVAQNKVFNGGLKIYMTQDPDVQQPMDEIFKDPKYFPLYDNYKDSQGAAEIPQGAMIIIDPYTGQIKALIGGRGEKKESRGLNRATQTPRQPGSSIKPIGVYGPAIELGVITPATVFDDVPVYLDNGRNKPQYHPENYDGKYWGLTTIRTAVTFSRNVIAIKTWLKLGAENSVNFLKKLGITTLTRDDKYASMALGGLSKGITVKEMAAAYVPFVNRGIYIKPITYTKIEDSNGKVLLENRIESRLVMAEQAAYIMTYMLEDVVKYGTAAGPNGAAIQKNEIATAGKTGTTSDNKDKWFVGFTPYLVGAVWYGYDQPRHMIDKGQAIKIWHDVMEKVHNNLKLGPKQFDIPSGIVTVNICRDSGMLPGPYCGQDPRQLDGSNYRVVDYKFIKGTEPTQTCTVHTPPVKICKDSGLLANEYCPATSIIEKVFIVRPEPYIPTKPEDAFHKDGTPIPFDRPFELPAGEYCNIHGPGTGTGSGSGTGIGSGSGVHSGTGDTTIIGGDTKNESTGATVNPGTH